MSKHLGKWIVLGGLILVAPWAYSYFMVFWALGTMPAVEMLGFSSWWAVFGLMVLLNSCGVALLSFVLVIPITYCFEQRAIWLSFLLAAAILLPNFSVWVLDSELKINFITFSEWGAILVLFPFVSWAVIHMRRKLGYFKNA